MVIFNSDVNKNQSSESRGNGFWRCSPKWYGFFLRSMTDVASRVSKFSPDIKMHPLKPGLIPEFLLELFILRSLCSMWGKKTGRISDGFLMAFPIPELGFRMFRRMYDDRSMADWTWWTWWNCKVIIPHMVSKIWCGIYMDQLVDKSTNNWRFTWKKVQNHWGFINWPLVSLNIKPQQ